MVSDIAAINILFLWNKPQLRMRTHIKNSYWLQRSLTLIEDQSPPGETAPEERDVLFAPCTYRVQEHPAPLEPNPRVPDIRAINIMSRWDKLQLTMRAQIKNPYWLQRSQTLIERSITIG